MKSLSNRENPACNHLPEACCGFLVATCDFKNCPKAACDRETPHKNLFFFQTNFTPIGLP
jgi:hypothetical protein